MANSGGGPRAARNRLELLALELATLFTLDEDGDLLAVNEHGGARAPQVFLGRCAEGDILRFRGDVDAGRRSELRALLARLSPWTPGRRSDEAVATLGAAFHGQLSAGPGYTFSLPLFPALGAMLLYPANAVLLHPELANHGPDMKHTRPAFAVMRNGAAVSLCFSSRATRAAAEAGVETAASFRGQGCAAVAVASWAAAIRESGRIPFYSTSWENTASQTVAAKLGLTQVSELIHVT